MFDVLVLAIGENKNEEQIMADTILVEKINFDAFSMKKYYHSIWPF